MQEIDGDMIHASCFRLLASAERVRISRNLSQESRRLIEDARRRMRGKT